MRLRYTCTQGGRQSAPQSQLRLLMTVVPYIICKLQNTAHIIVMSVRGESALQKVRMRLREAQGVARVRAVRNDPWSGPCSSIDFIRSSRSTVLFAEKVVTNSV